MAAGLSDFFKYNLWANLRLLDQCVQLSDVQLDATLNGVFGNIRATVMHLIGSEAGYVRALTGSFPLPQLDYQADFPGFEDLRRRATLSGEMLITVAAQNDHDRILRLDNGTYDVPAMNVLIQVINHGIDHRSQIATLLSHQGITPVDLDGWSYNDALK